MYNGAKKDKQILRDFRGVGGVKITTWLTLQLQNTNKGNFFCDAKCVLSGKKTMKF